MLRYFVIAFVGILVYRFLFCLSGFMRAVYYEQKYEQYIAGKLSEFASYTAPVKKLLKQAAVSDTTVADTEFIGYGQIRSFNASVMENLTAKRVDIIANVLAMLAKAKGTFRMKLLECFSPLYWVQLAVFLPAKLCTYLGISDTALISKILQVAYWLAMPLFLFFRAQLYDFIVQMVQQAQ